MSKFIAKYTLLEVSEFFCTYETNSQPDAPIQCLDEFEKVGLTVVQVLPHTGSVKVICRYPVPKEELPKRLSFYYEG